MKKICISLILGFFSPGGFAQATATATTSVTIVKPLSITKEVDLDFAEIAVGENGGSVVLSTDGSRSYSGDISLPTVPARTATAASFTVKGEEADYSVSLPQEIYLSDGKNTIKVDSFTHDSSGTITNGEQELHIGASLHLNGLQAPGEYENTNDLKVTVNYN